MKTQLKKFYIMLSILLTACSPQATPAVVTVVVTATPNPQSTQAISTSTQSAPVATNTPVVQNTNPTVPAGGQPSGSTSGSQIGGATLAATYTLDLKRLPIGDKKISSSAQRGYVWSCRSNFAEGQVGASATGPWYNAAAGTYDVTAKPVVDGAVTWASQFAVSASGNSRVIKGNDLPSHTTGQYPISSNDDAYQYDRNPNKISSQTLQLTLNANPTVNPQASCIGGEVGISLTGSYIFNAFDAGGRDAVAHELQDHCAGHPQSSGVYHYHSVPSPQCVNDTASGHSKLLGYALDGFGLYGYHGESGKNITNAELDECHGHAHEIEWDGKNVVMYHYHATWEFPYTVGCFRGTAVRLSLGEGGGQQPGGQQSGGGQQPPPTRPGGSPPPPRP